MSLEVTDLDAARDLSIREIADLPALAEAARLFDEVWNNSADAPLISAATLRAMAHAGNFVSAAYREGEMVGALVGFLGLHGGELQLHSHILGVAPEAQGRSIGYALKLHQRAWALERAIATIAWTFDPLVRRNAYFNLSKLGASIVAYYERFYGDMPDGINTGDESDRVLVHWSLAAADGALHVAEPDLDALRSGAATILASRDDESPVLEPGRDAATLLAQVPEDIVGLRRRDPSLAVEWRRAVRAALGGALASGYRASAMTRSGWYVLTRDRRA